MINNDEHSSGEFCARYNKKLEMKKCEWKGANVVMLSQRKDVLCGMRIAEFRKGVFCEIKIRKMFLLLSYVNWISVQFYRALDHHAQKPRCVLQKEIVG